MSSSTSSPPSAAHHSFDPASVGAALLGRDGPLCALEARLGDAVVRVTSVGFESTACATSGLWKPPAAGGTPAQAVKTSLVARGEWSRGGETHALVSRDDRVHRDSPLLGLPLAPDARARAEAALAAWLAEQLEAGPDAHAADDAGCALVDALASALLPEPDRASLFGWVRHDFARWAREPEGALAAVAAGESSWTMDFSGNLQAEISVLDWGMVYARVQIRLNGTTVIETSLPPTRLSLESLSLRAPDADTDAVRALRSAWREHLKRQLRAVADGHARGDDHAAIDALSTGESLIAVLESWAVDGPPPVHRPRVAVNELAVARAAGTIRKLAGADLVAAGGQRVCATAAYALGGDLILLRAMGSGATEDEAPDDEVWLQRGSEPAVPLLARPPHAEFSRTIDGDADAMREVLAWLRATIVRAGCDASFFARDFGAEWAASALAELGEIDAPGTSPADDRADEVVGREVTVSEWLKFERWPGHPTFDWRCPNDTLDRARSLLDDDAPDSPAAARRDDVTRFYEFVRRWIDPRFVGRLERS